MGWGGGGWGRVMDVDMMLGMSSDYNGCGKVELLSGLL